VCGDDLSCGLRISEVCGLQACIIDEHERLVRVRGRGKGRLIPIANRRWAITKALAVFASTRWPSAGFLAGSRKLRPSARDPTTFEKAYLAVVGLDPQLTPQTAIAMRPTCLPGRTYERAGIAGHAHLALQVYTHVTTGVSNMPTIRPIHARKVGFMNGFRRLSDLLKTRRQPKDGTQRYRMKS
jgi:integrase